VAPSLAGFCLLLASSFPKAEGRRQKAEGRRQKAEGRRQKAEGRRQKAEGRRQKAEATFAVVKQGSAKKYKSESYEY
jgi:hypothetical protein